MPINFPNNPSLDQIFSSSNGVDYIGDGNSWSSTNIFTLQKATEAEAEAGTNNENYTTPFLVKTKISHKFRVVETLPGTPDSEIFYFVKE